MAKTIEELIAEIAEKDAIIEQQAQEIEDLKNILDASTIDKVTFVGKNGLKFGDGGKSVQIGENWYAIKTANFVHSKLNNARVFVINENTNADLISQILTIKGQTALIQK